ncbi:hypothetical protein GCM10010341_88400 [Streptomyces noursei]|nr:hypothetical protein GCM10010341_88400 [Streptomyces noursei]
MTRLLYTGITEPSGPRPLKLPRCEPAHSGCQALDDFHADAEDGDALDEVSAVAAVNPCLAYGGVGGGRLVQQVGAGDAVC